MKTIGSYILFGLISISVGSCNQNNSKQVANKGERKSGKSDSALNNKAHSSDTTKVSYPYIERFYKLKNRYDLVFMEVSFKDDSGMRVLLQHEHESKYVLGWAPFGCGGELVADFDSSFVIGWGCGSGNPEYIYAYDKKAGKTLLETDGFVLYKAQDKGILLWNDRDKYDENFVLYDFNKRKFELYKEPTNNPCNCCHCWNLVKLTNSELVISYEDGKDKKQTVKYKRQNANH